MVIDADIGLRLWTDLGSRPEVKGILQANSGTDGGSPPQLQASRAELRPARAQAPGHTAFCLSHSLVCGTWTGRDSRTRPRRHMDRADGHADDIQGVATEKIRWIGVSNFNVEQLKRAQAIAPVSTLQPPYHLLKPEVQDEILPYCLDQGIGVINYSPMASGLLAGKMTRERIENMPEDDWRKNSDEFTEPNLSRNMELVDLLRSIGDRHGRSTGVVAIAWTLHNPAVTGAIVGARRPSQVDEIIDAAEFRLSDDEYEQIEAFRKQIAGANQDAAV